VLHWGGIILSAFVLFGLVLSSCEGCGKKKDDDENKTSITDKANRHDPATNPTPAPTPADKDTPSAPAPTTAPTPTDDKDKPPVPIIPATLLL
jgi:type IV secretory pathway VirB10-like protein